MGPLYERNLILELSKVYALGTILMSFLRGWEPQWNGGMEQWNTGMIWMKDLTSLLAWRICVGMSGRKMMESTLAKYEYFASALLHCHHYNMLMANISSNIHSGIITATRTVCLNIIFIVNVHSILGSLNLYDSLHVRKREILCLHSAENPDSSAAKLTSELISFELAPGSLHVLTLTMIYSKLAMQGV